MDAYIAQKSELIKSVAQLAEVAANRKNSFAVALLEETAQRLRREIFTLVVLGEFKRGKSTFINALLGEAILPAAIIPLTAIPTILQYGQHPAARVVFLEGAEKSIAMGEIADYATERGNPGNHRKVREVYIEYPSAFLQQGVILVDTPGVGSAHQHNTDAAYAYLPHADAAIFLISVDAPLSKVELDYLKDICSYVKKVFFVMNKIDVVSPEDLAEAREFTTGLLGENLDGRGVELFPVSARQALEGKTALDAQKLSQSGMDRLEKILNDFIHRGKGRLIMDVAARRSLRVISELELELQLWRRAMESSSGELENRIACFDKELQKLEDEREDSIYLLYREVDRLGKTAEEDVAAYRDGILPVLLEELEQYAREQFRAGVSNRDLSRILNDFIRNTIQHNLEKWRHREQGKMSEAFEAVAHRFFGRIEDVVDRMMSTSADIFDIAFEKIASREFILGDRRFYFHFEEHPTFIPSLDSLGVTSLIPRALLQGHIVKNARDKMTELLDRNCGRVRYDLVEGLKESVRTVAGDLRLRADAVFSGLQSVLDQALEQRKADGTEKAADATAWEKAFDKLQRLKEVLTPFLSS
jgi:ribosome biogenesis GTPase A